MLIRPIPSSHFFHCMISVKQAASYNWSTKHLLHIVEVFLKQLDREKPALNQVWPLFERHLHLLCWHLCFIYCRLWTSFMKIHEEGIAQGDLFSVSRTPKAIDVCLSNGMGDEAPALHGAGICNATCQKFKTPVLALGASVAATHEGPSGSTQTPLLNSIQDHSFDKYYCNVHCSCNIHINRMPKSSSGMFLKIVMLTPCCALSSTPHLSVTKRTTSFICVPPN